MALLLYAFSLLGTTLPIQLQAAMAIGAFTNPLLFIVIAIKPTVSRAKDFEHRVIPVNNTGQGEPSTTIAVVL